MNIEHEAKENGALVKNGDGKESGEGTTAEEEASTAAAASTAAPAATLEGSVAIMTDGEEVGKKITTDAVKEEKIQSLQKEENSSSGNLVLVATSETIDGEGIANTTDQLLRPMDRPRWNRSPLVGSSPSRFSTHDDHLDSGSNHTLEQRRGVSDTTLKLQRDVQVTRTNRRVEFPSGGDDDDDDDDVDDDDVDDDDDMNNVLRSVVEFCDGLDRCRSKCNIAADNVNNNNDERRNRGAPPGWHADTASHRGQKRAPLHSSAASSSFAQTPDPYNWDDDDTFHDVVGKNQGILQLEKAHHLQYLLEYRVRQCPLFLLGKCQSHKPFTCFHWHFLNQRRRRPARREDGSYNYSPYIYCSKYDEKTGVCDDGDNCTYLHHNLGDTECIYHLRYFKTTPCIHSSKESGMCRRYGRHCAFCHSDDDFRAPIFDNPSPAMAPLLTYSTTAAPAALESIWEVALAIGGETEGKNREQAEFAPTDCFAAAAAAAATAVESLLSKQPRAAMGKESKAYSMSRQYLEDGGDVVGDADGDDDDEKYLHQVEDGRATVDVAGGNDNDDDEEADDAPLTDASDWTRGRKHESFGIWEQALNQARAACEAWRQEAEEAKTQAEEKEKEKQREKGMKEETLSACERLSAKMALMINSGDESQMALSASFSPSSSSPEAAKEFWRVLCQMDEGALKVDGASLDKLAEMKRILVRCLENVETAIEQKNAVLRKIWEN